MLLKFSSLNWITLKCQIHFKTWCFSVFLSCFPVQTSKPSEIRRSKVTEDMSKWSEFVLKTGSNICQRGSETCLNSKGKQWHIGRYLFLIYAQTHFILTIFSQFLRHDILQPPLDISNLILPRNLSNWINSQI